MKEEQTGGESEAFSSLLLWLARSRQLASDALERLNRPELTMDVVRDILLGFKENACVEAVGIRLREGDDFPYYEASGFPATFVETERHLCARDAAGEVIRDAAGRPVLECMCGNVLCGRSDPAKPFFTPGGSFWTNSTTELLATTSERDRLRRMCDRCNGHGYESVALIPLRMGDEVIGLIQLNDRRKGMFTPERIVLFEGIGASIGIALARIRAETTAKESAARYRAVFNGASDGMAVADRKTGRLLECNPALCRMVEREKMELLAQPQTILHPAQDFIDGKSSTFRQHLQRENGPALEDTLLTKSGALVPVEIRAAHIRFGKRDCVLGVFRDITERKRAEDALHQSTADLHALAAHLQVVREEERAVLARNLHDGLGQYLTALHIDLSWLTQRLKASALPDVATLCDKVVSMARQVELLTTLTQDVCASLRPAVLDDLGLVAAIEWLAEDAARHAGAAVATSLPDADIELGRDFALAAFRIAQEALTNVCRHARAAHVEIRLRAVERELQLEIQDDGQGFEPDSLPTLQMLGLLGMRERAAAFGGTVDLLSKPGKGTTVRVRMPLVRGAP